MRGIGLFLSCVGRGSRGPCGARGAPEPHSLGGAGSLSSAAISASSDGAPGRATARAAAPAHFARLGAGGRPLPADDWPRPTSFGAPPGPRWVRAEGAGWRTVRGAPGDTLPAPAAVERLTWAFARAAADFFVPARAVVLRPPPPDRAPPADLAAKTQKSNSNPRNSVGSRSEMATSDQFDGGRSCSMVAPSMAPPRPRRAAAGG